MVHFLCVKFWIEAFPNIWWGIVTGIVIIWSLYLVKSLINNYIDSKEKILVKKQDFEKRLKEDMFNRDKEMKRLNDLKESTDEALKNQNNDLKKEKNELESKLKTEKINNELLKRQLKIYRDIFEDLKVDVKPKEK